MEKTNSVVKSKMIKKGILLTGGTVATSKSLHEAKLSTRPREKLMSQR